MNNIHNEQKARKALEEHTQATKALKFVLWVAVVVISAVVMILPAEAADFDVKSYLAKTYITIGAGYKFQETNLKLNKDGVQSNWNEPMSARIEVYYQYSKNVTFGISHHSQWLTGFPFNDDSEYSKTEVFIDYTFSLGGLL